MKTPFLPFQIFYLALVPLIGILPNPIQAQTIAGDLCQEAIWLKPNDLLREQRNNAATLNEAVVPESNPITCIKTFENDLWYQMETNETYTYYQVDIIPQSCETPAGLQALIIQADSCSPSTYEYIQCANPNREVALTLGWTDTIPGRHYFIYVDGFDGNQCTFSIQLTAYVKDPRVENPTLLRTFDYNMSDSSLRPKDFQVKFLNNEMYLRWEASTEANMADFRVQYFAQPRGSKPFATTLARLEPQALAGSEALARYEFVHRITFTQDKEYCYRIIRTYTDGRREYSPFRCMTANLNEDFYISPVFPHDRPNVYKVQFINWVKQDLTYTVYNESGEVQKSLLRAKEKKGDGIITIDMQEFPPGLYQLTIEGREETFTRPFFVE